MTEEVAKIPQVEMPEIPEPKEPEMRWDEVLARIDKVGEIVGRLPQEQKDDAPILARIDDVLSAIDAKEVTEKTDLKPILDKLSEDTDTNELNHDEVKGMIDEAQKKTLKAIPAEVTKALKKVKIVTAVATHFAVDGKKLAMDKAKNEQDAENTTEEKAKPEEVDHMALANSLSS